MAYTCPVCGATSNNPNDEREDYCGRCHDWTGGQRRPSALLTPAEHRAVILAGELYTLIVTEIIGKDDSRAGDVRELCAYIHGIQHMVLAQAAARAYPARYRLLGGVLPSRIEEVPGG